VRALDFSWHFARPELAEQHLQAFNLGLISATALHARRRMGKTEFLTKDLTPAAEKKGYTVGYCNLWQEDQDPAAAIAQAITACSAPQHIVAGVGAIGVSRHMNLKQAHFCCTRLSAPERGYANKGRYGC
jgi:hypothetical protein